MSTTKTRRSVSLLAAFAVAAGALAMPAAASQAAPTFGLAATTERAPSLVDLDAAKTGSITIHKLVKQDDNGTKEGNGLVDPSATGKPLAGATFTVEKLTSVDLTKQEGWEKLANYRKGKGDEKISANAAAIAAARADGTGTPVSMTTGDDGLATFNNLALGAYIVTETQTPAGYTGSRPFIITVPMTHPTELNNWVYDVHAYPKNAKVNVEKEVDDAQTPAVGSAISYTITADVPDAPVVDYYNVVDQYDKRVNLPENQIMLQMVEAKDGDVPLVKGEDYTLTPAVGTDGKTNFWTAEFTEAGRKKMIAQRKSNDTKIVMSLEGTLKEKIGDEGLVENKAILLPGAPANNWKPGSGEVPPPEYPNAKVVSKFGKVTITKTSSVDETKKLEGAEFQVYKCKPTSKPAKNFESVDATLDTKLTVDGKDTFVTDDQGKVTIDGLRNNDWEDNEEVADPGYYCLVETKAPDGFELQSRPIAFQVLASNSTKDNKYTLETTVKDVPKNGGFNLPLTGAAGVGVLIGTGALLVAGSGAIVLANKRRKEQADA